jgi:DNA polymerase III sliding clamp (beta) subunit (PCNA family)
LENTELLAIENDSNHVRQTDYDFLISQETKAIIKEEGIILLDYREIQSIWNKVSDE